MIASIHLACLGNHLDTTLDLDPAGVSHVRGPTGAGKSSVTDAICFLVDGKDAHGNVVGDDHITVGEKAADITITTAKGTQFRRQKSIKGATKRRRTIGETTEDFTADADWQWFDDTNPGPLGPFGKPTLARAVCSPMWWLDQLASPTGRVEIRDLLERELPGPTAADLIRAGLRDGEPDTEKRAVEARKDANNAVKAAAGRVAEAKAALDATKAGKPEAPQGSLSESQSALANLAGAIAAHRDAVAARDRWLHDLRRHDEGAANHAAWTAKGAPAAPTVERPEAAEVAKARAAHEAAATRLDELRATRERAEGDRFDGASFDRQIADARRLLEQAQRDLARAKDDAAMVGAVPCRGATLHALTSDDPGPVPVECGDCQLLAGAKAAKGTAERLRGEIDQHAVALKGFEDERAAAESGWALQNAKRIEHLDRAIVAATTTYTEAREADTILRDAQRAWADYDRARAEFPPEPTIPPHPGEEPAVPVKPDDGPVRAAIEANQRHEGAVTAWRQAMSRALEALGNANTAHATAKAKADRLDAVVTLIREAPVKALKGKLDALGDTGPVSIQIKDGDLDVRIHGRSWRRASTGERIVASAWFRHALRVAAGAAWLPLVIDEAQSVGGRALPMPAPCIVMWTTAEGEGLTVGGVQ